MIEKNYVNVLLINPTRYNPLVVFILNYRNEFFKITGDNKFHFLLHSILSFRDYENYDTRCMLLVHFPS